jgi:4-hydroxy-tetrahydrodipicolinate synthase
MLNFGSLITAMITPFDKKGAVDYKEAIHLAHHLIKTGTDTLLLTGTTGESPTLLHSEEYELYKQFVSEFKGKTPIMAGTGSNSTKTAIEATQKAESIGVDASLQVVPYYNKPSQEGMYQHFKSISENTSLPILLYNIPGRTGVNMKPETIARLAQLPRIFGIKEASGSVEQVAEIKALVPQEFKIYSGDDALTVSFMKEGAIGVVCVASHLCGEALKTIINHATVGQWDVAKVQSQELNDLFEALFITANPTPLKYALRECGFKVGYPRLPLVDVTEAEAAIILTSLKKHGLCR